MAGLQSDDDDMPEEVTLNEGREEVEQSLRRQKENSKRLAAELRETRKSRSEKKRKERVADADAVSEQKPNENEVTALPEKSRVRKRKGRRADASNSGEELEGKDVGPVKLDESVLELLRDREKREKGVGEAKHKYIEEQPEPEPKVKKLLKSDYDAPSNSRTQIVNLKAKPNSAAVNIALEYRRNHFFGSHVKRSITMLPNSSRPHFASV